MAVTTVIALAVCLAAGVATTATIDRELECGLETSGVYVALSSEAEEVDDHFLRWVDVHWFGMTEVGEGDWVGLWAHNPGDGLDDSLAEYAALTTDGSFRTEQRWNGSLIPDNVSGMGDFCLPLWAGYVRGGVLIHSSCLMLHPNWMSGLRDTLADVRLSKVVLPGTHDAGASGHFKLSIVGDLVGRWTFTQDESFWQQLVLGVRYLDVRIAYYNGTAEKFFINHGDVRIAPLKRYLENVAAFLSQTDEILIFDIHQASVGFDKHPERHHELMSFLESYLQQWMVPKSLSPDPTLAEIWATGKLIVTYPSSEASGSPFYWGNVYHLWGNVNRLEDLEAFLYTSIPQQVNRESLWSAMAEFTPTALDVTLDRWGGLRGAAAVTNTPVTQWFRQDFWDQVNIVAMDFLPSSDVVSVAIEANKMKVQCAGKPKRVTDRARQWAAISPNKSEDYKTNICADFVGTGGVGVRVWPTLQALPRGETTNLQFRLVQINWEAEEVLEGDWVGVFDRNPRKPGTPKGTPLGTLSRDDVIGDGDTPTFWDMPPPLFWDTPFSTMGGVTSNVTEPRPELTVLAAGGCVGHWVGYVRNGLCVAAQCLAAYPQWLWDNKDVLGSRSLRSLMLPGTHNAGSYSLRDADDVVTAWVVCQDEDILNQLLYGIRYLDLRVGYYPETPELLWINHDLVRWRPLEEVLNQIKVFLAISRDPVIIDIHRMPVGFEMNEAFSMLLNLMNETLGEDFLSERYGSQVTLDQVWATGKQAIFAFADIDVSEDVDWVWPPLPQAWANAQTLEDLRRYLDTQMARRAASPRLWAAMCHLTPTLWDLLLRSHVGVRGMADKSNPIITTWLQKRWAHLANIVASDFFRGNDIINVAIRTNLALSVCPSPNSQGTSPLRRSAGFRLSELPRKLTNPIWETIKNFEGDLLNTTTPPYFTTQPPLFRSFTSSTPPFQRITTSPPPEFTTPPYQRITTPPYQRVTKVPLQKSDVLETTTLPPPPSSTSSPSTSTFFTPSSTTSSTSTEANAHDNAIRPSETLEMSLISPIHSILDLFGFSTANTTASTPSRGGRRRRLRQGSRRASQREGRKSNDRNNRRGQKSEAGKRRDDPSDPDLEAVGSTTDATTSSPSSTTQVPLSRHRPTIQYIL